MKRGLLYAMPTMIIFSIMKVCESSALADTSWWTIVFATMAGAVAYALATKGAP